MDVSGEVASVDRTTIRWFRTGTGPSLVFVHGGLSRIGDYTDLSRALGTAVSVVSLGRRGYGFSDDGPAYSYQAEAQDILAVVRATHPASWAMGHSSGAICTLLAARAGSLDKVILYEPPLPSGVPVLATDRRRAAEAAVGRGDADEAIMIGLVDGVKLPAGVVASLRADPQWDDLRPLASAWIREFAEIDALTDLSWCHEVSAEVLLLWGSDTQPHHRRAVERLSRLLPNATQRRIEGQGHDGPITAARHVASAVLEFLRPSTLGFKGRRNTLTDSEVL